MSGTVKAPRNENFSKLAAGYLFPVVRAKKEQYLVEHPDAKVISLGVGDTTHPLPQVVGDAMVKYAQGLCTWEDYSGYDPVVLKEVSQELAKAFYTKNGTSLAAPEEIFVSDGSKCDIARLQTLFSNTAKVALQDPAYPAYVDNTVISGRTGGFNNDTKMYENIAYLPCTEENEFFPDLSLAEGCHILYFCNPNNPTGACASRGQLEQLVKFCLDRGIVLLYDAAYAYYIEDPEKPRTIYEIEGARKCAIETNSFSKLAGFTGVRLGWTVVPNEITYPDNTKMINDWSRIFNTQFNGASNVAAAGGLAVLRNLDEIHKVVKYYKQNAKLIVETFTGIGFKTYGGVDSPYVFVKVPGRGSWEVFQEILEKVQVITTPGVGFGPAGEGFVRVSAYGSREEVETACARFKAMTW